MKKTTVIGFVLLFVFTGMAYAGTQTKQNCGCGLGSLMFQDQTDGLITQVCAVTTNGTFGNQTFGITSGTLGCNKFTTIAMREKLNIFVADNMDNVASDIASGEGESLEAIADLAHVRSENRAALYVALQDNFEFIYPSAQITHEEVVQKIAEIIEHI